jgi:hypothetical protein
VFRGISSVTGAINTTTSSFNTEFGKIGSTTASIHVTTASLNTYTGSNETWKTGVRGEVSALEAWTASLDNTYATDAQLYQLYQATASIHFTTSSLNTQTGSQDLVNRGISSVTGSINTTTSSFNTEFSKIGSTTSSIHFATSSLNTQTGSQANLNAQIGIATSSLNFATSSLNTFTGSLRSEVNLIEAYTASLKGAAIVSSSQQITNYYKFAETASANTFYGNQTFASSAGSGLRVYGAAGTHQWDIYLNGQNLRLSDNTTGDGAVRVDQRLDVGGHITASGNLLTNSNLYVTTGNGAGKKIFLDGNTTKRNWMIAAQENVDNTLEITPSTTNGGSTYSTPAVKIDGTTNNVTIANNLILPSGGGIDFSANTGGAGKSSQLLDDYEEGIITATITCGTSGTVTLDSAYNTLSYTKIGGVVHLFGLLNVTSVSSPVGTFKINLPFSIVNLADAGGTSCANIVVNNTVAANIADFVAWADETTSELIVRLGDNSDAQGDAAQELQALTDIYVQFTYRTN